MRGRSLPRRRLPRADGPQLASDPEQLLVRRRPRCSAPRRRGDDQASTTPRPFTHDVCGRSRTNDFGRASRDPVRHSSSAQSGELPERGEEQTGRRAWCIVPGQPKSGMQGTLTVIDAIGTLGGAMAKRYHVTTFGCQMNEHDSERMKGMLDSLGYEEAAERDEADLILFNTCSIRESADNRFIAHLGEAKRLKGEDPERVVGVGGCWAQSVKDEVFERFPFVDVAFGPGQIHRLAEFLTSDSLTRAGLLRVRGLLRAPADQARARVPGLGADLAGLQLRLLLLHRPLDARARGRAATRASSSPRSSASPPTACAR